MITQQPYCQNGDRILLKKFDASVRLLLGKHLQNSKYQVSCTLFNQDNKPVPITKNGKPFQLSKNIAELKRQKGTNVYTAYFRY